MDKRKKITIAYAVILLLIVLFPPWDNVGYKGVKQFYGFSSIIFKKEPCITEKIKIKENCTISNYFDIGCPGGPKTWVNCTNLEINTIFLLIEILIVSLIFAAIFYSNKEKK